MVTLGRAASTHALTSIFETAEGIKNYHDFVHQAADIVLSYGGSLSGEHGDGQARAELLPEMFGNELIEAFREFKSLWDPDWKMNPGKVVNAYRLTENLRLGTDYNPPAVKTHFSFPMTRAALRGQRCAVSALASVVSTGGRHHVSELHGDA